MHKPVRLQNLSLSFSHKICFENFTTDIHYGSRIAIIGRNGCGKSSLLNLFRKVIVPTSGSISIPSDVTMGYLPQVIDTFNQQSGGERVNCALTQALKLNPNFLILDEPSNHLDERNRRQMLRYLSNFPGTLLVVSHDVALLRQSVEMFWHIDQGNIQTFTGSFDDYQQTKILQRASLESTLYQLKRQQKNLHQSLMQEQQRAAKSKSKGAKSIAQRKWPTVVSQAKAGRSQETSGRKKADLASKKHNLVTKLAELHIPEVILPQFHLAAKGTRQMVVSINQGAVGYAQNQWLLQNIYLSVSGNSRIALTGDNASGKSTLFKGILASDEVIRQGEWLLPQQNLIGYLDQHYATLDSNKTVLTSTQALMPDCSEIEVHRHLSDFLFRSQIEVNLSIAQLSGGEKARLSLAHIAARTPQLLLLDEVTNNLDLETRQHMIEALRDYPGSLIVISHDKDFLQAIKIQDYYEIINGTINKI